MSKNNGFKKFNAPTLMMQKIVTALCFFSLGFSTAAWAPLIPYAQQRLALDHADFGLLLLCVGVGSMLSMPIAGRLTQSLGCRCILAVVLAAFILILPALSLSSSISMMAVSLFFFGVSAGALGVTVNIQASAVEKRAEQSLMSFFHGLCSLGGLAGVLSMTTLLSLGLRPFHAAVLIATLILIIALIATPFCLTRTHLNRSLDNTKPEIQARIQPNLTIVCMTLICFIAFLTEGAAMDWSGIYLSENFNIAATEAGWAYSSFAAFMVIGRFSGQLIIQHLGENSTIRVSALIASVSLFAVVFAPVWQIVLIGYALLGLGCANIVPLMFSRASRQQKMPAHVALSYVSVMGYTGALIGPALVGLSSQVLGLGAVFSLIALALLSIGVFHYFSLERATATPSSVARFHQKTSP